MLASIARDGVPTTFVNARGEELPDGICIAVDSNVDTFTIKIHSSSGVSKEELVRMIQEKYKVVKCIHEHKQVVSQFHKEKESPQEH